jgi:hypothetical protein
MKGAPHPQPGTIWLSRHQAAYILFGDRLYEDDFDPAVDSFRSGADIAEDLACHFWFSYEDYRAIASAARKEM